MNLLQIRQQFVKLSGRYDLATTSVDSYDTDNGADFYVQSGARYLDRIANVKQTKASYFKQVLIGAWYLDFPRCLSIESVWCNSSDSRWQLTKYPYQTMQKNFTGLVSEADGGSPQFYCPIWLRSTDSDDFQASGTFFNYIKPSDDGTYNGILFSPKTDGSYVFEIVGRFMSKELLENDDTNYWTNIAPEILLKAAIYQLEIFSFNRRKAAEWLAEIRDELRAMEFNMVEEESNETRILE